MFIKRVLHDHFPCFICIKLNKYHGLNVLRFLCTFSSIILTRRWKRLREQKLQQNWNKMEKDLKIYFRKWAWFQLWMGFISPNVCQVGLPTHMLHYYYFQSSFSSKVSIFEEYVYFVLHSKYYLELGSKDHEQTT